MTVTTSYTIFTAHPRDLIPYAQRTLPSIGPAAKSPSGKPPNSLLVRLHAEGNIAKSAAPPLLKRWESTRDGKMLIDAYDGKVDWDRSEQHFPYNGDIQQTQEQGEEISRRVQKALEYNELTIDTGLSWKNWRSDSTYLPPDRAPCYDVCVDSSIVLTGLAGGFIPKGHRAAATIMLAGEQQNAWLFLSGLLGAMRDRIEEDGMPDWGMIIHASCDEPAILELRASEPLIKTWDWLMLRYLKAKKCGGEWASVTEQQQKSDLAAWQVDYPEKVLLEMAKGGV